MRRRDFLPLLLGTLPGAGCLQTETPQVEQVPVWVTNQTAQRRTAAVGWTDTEADDSLVSTAVTLDPEQEESVYAEPITADGEYLVTVGVGAHSQEKQVSGGRLRSVEATVRAADSVQIERVSM